MTSKTKPVGARRINRLVLERVLGQLRQSFTTREFRAACEAEGLKYDTVQRRLLRLKRIRIAGTVSAQSARAGLRRASGSPERRYKQAGVR